MNQNTSKPFRELLSRDQRLVFGKLKDFSTMGILGGGTALMLQVGHRKSHDFDLLLPSKIPQNLLFKLNETFKKSSVVPKIDSSEELTVFIDQAKLTFLSYPFPPLHKPIAIDFVNVSSLDDIASSKAYTVGRRPTWRDYVDLYMLLRDHTTLDNIISEANTRFGGNFSEKLFLEQLTYYADIADFSIEFIGPDIQPGEIQAFLIREVKEYMKSHHIL